MEQQTKQSTAPQTEQTPQPPLAREKRSYTCTQRLLLLATLAVGVLFERMLHSDGSVLFGVFWLVALAVFVWLNFERVRHERAALAVGIPAAALAILSMLGYQNESVSLLMLAAIPAAMMTFAVLSTQAVPKGRESAVALGVIRGVFIKPFSGIPAWFGALGSLFTSKRASNAKRIGVGLLIGLPLVALVLQLLTSADANMSALVNRFTGFLTLRMNAGELLWRVLVVVAVAVPFYSLFFNMTWGKRDTLPPAAQKSWSLTAPAVIVGLLLACYAAFVWVQFGYLYSRTLPVDLTYSKYAREGFWQLIAVALINFTVLGVCFVKCKPARALRVLETLLLVATLLLLASALWRLLLYIGAYGLTIRRILPLWLMAYLIGLVCVAVVRVWREKTLLLRISAYALLYWFVLLAAVPWDAIIAAYNAVPLV